MVSIQIFVRGRTIEDACYLASLDLFLELLLIVRALPEGEELADDRVIVTVSTTIQVHSPYVNAIIEHRAALVDNSHLSYRP